MCSACGIPTHVLELDEVAPADEMTALSAGVHWLLGLSSAAMCDGTVLAAIYVYWRPRRPAMLDTQTATPQQERT